MFIRDTSNGKKVEQVHYIFNHLTEGALFRFKNDIYIRLDWEIEDKDGNVLNCVNLRTGELDWFNAVTEVDIYFDDVELDFSKFKSYKL